MGKSDDPAGDFETDCPPLQLDELFEKVADERLAKPTHLATAKSSQEEDDDVEFMTERLHDKTIGYTTPKKPAELYHDKAEMLKQYSNFNVDDSDGLRKWQKRVIQRLTPGLQTAPAERNAGKFKQEEFDMVKEASEEGIRTLLSQDVVNDQTVTPEEYKAVTSGFSGSRRQAGPVVRDAINALGFVLDQEATDADRLHRKCYHCQLLPDIKRFAFEWQITAMADILVKSVGKIPIDGVPQEHLDKAEVASALTELSGLAVYGHLNADQTGLGKTISELYALSWMVRYSIQVDENGAQTHCPTLINVPKQVAEQWVDEIKTYFPNLQLFISAGETSKAFGDRDASRYTIPEYLIDEN